MAKTNSTRIRRRTCHSEIATHDEFDREDAFASCLLATSSDPGMTSLWISRSWKICCKWRYDRKETWELVTHQVIQKRIMVDLGLLKSGKVELRSTIDQGNLRTTSWDILQNVDPHREEPLLGGNAHSARYGETIHDGSEKPETVNHQRRGKFRKFRHGQWRSRICEQSQRPSAKQTEKNVERCRVRWRGIQEYGECSWLATMNAGDIHGKEFSQLFKVSSRILKISRWNRCSISPRSWWITRRKFMVWTIHWGKEFLETSVIDWWWNSYQSSAHKSLCLLRFCVVLRKGSSTSRIQRSLEEHSCRCPIREKATEIMMLSTESRRNSSGTFSQDSQRCSSVVKSMIYWATWETQKTEYFHRKNSIYVNVQWHLLWQKRQQRWMLGKCWSRESTCEKIWYWTMVILLDQVLKKKWYSAENSPQGAWDNIAEQMLLLFEESGHPIFRATTPLSRGILKSKRTRKAVDTLRCRCRHNWYNFSHYPFCQSASVSTELVGSRMWRIWEPSRSIRGNLRFWWGQSIVLGEN